MRLLLFLVFLIVPLLDRGSAAVVLGKRTETAFELGKCARAW